jgi:hypothetical protein
MRWTEYVACMEEMESEYRTFVGKPEWKRPLGRSRLRWEDNIRIDLWEIGWEVEDWMHLAQDRDRWLVLVNMVMNLQVP